MTAKHTPGPWQIKERETFSDESVYPRHIVGGTEEFQVCLLESPYAAKAITSANQRLVADARLIAAAPELLEALNAFVDFFAPQYYMNSGGEFQKLRADALAAIAKATGAA